MCDENADLPLCFGANPVRPYRMGYLCSARESQTDGDRAQAAVGSVRSKWDRAATFDTAPLSGIFRFCFVTTTDAWQAML